MALDRNPAIRAASFDDSPEYRRLVGEIRAALGDVERTVTSAPLTPEEQAERLAAAVERQSAAIDNLTAMVRRLASQGGR